MTNAIYTAALRLMGGAGSGQAYQLLSTQEIVIGREAGCQILLDSQQHSGVSRRHAMIRAVPTAQTFEVCDLNSGNGTFVNGQRIAGCQLLRAGDRISLGQNGVTFSFEPVANVPSQQPDSALTLSNVFPLIGTRKDLIKKAYLIPGIVTVIFVAILFSASGSNPLRYIAALGVYLSFAAYYFVYQLCGKRKPIWEIITAGVIEMLLLSPIPLAVAVFIFYGILPGGGYPDGGLIQRFIGYFFGAGMMEELLKAIPVFLLMWLGRWRSTARSGVREPLDGILLGAAAGAAFTLVETLGKYVPGLMLDVASQLGRGEALLAGTQLLIPRVLGSIAGHMAYSGYFGYFIGLSVLKPSKRWQLLAIGYFSSALLHALWNTLAGSSDIFMVIIGGLSYAFLVAVILQARKLSPNRSDNFATRFHP